MTKSSKLYRSNTDKVIGGVAGGLSDYLDIDPVIIRILFVLLAIFGGSGVLVYIILWIAIPAEIVSFQNVDNKDDKGDTIDEVGPAGTSRRTNTSLVAGIILIAFGLIFLLNQLVPLYGIIDFWPLLLVLAGVLLIRPELLKTSKKIKS